MSVKHKIIFTFNTSDDKKFSLTLPNVDENYEASEVIAVGEAIKDANVIMPKEGSIEDVSSIKYIKTAVTEYDY